MSGLSVAGLLRDAEARLKASPSPRLDAELLLGRALGRERSWLYAFSEVVPLVEQAQTFEALLQRREQGEPVAYILGQRGFWTLDLQVNADTLIPRPDTELLVETALALLSPEPAAVLDLGTGTGAIALALASERSDWRVMAVDRSAGALHIAQMNGNTSRLKNVQFALSDWYSALAGVRFALIVSNPPYIAENDPHLREGDVRFEPQTALVAGADGLDDIRHIVQSAPEHLEPGGWLAFEHGYDQGQACRALLVARGFTCIETRRDLGGQERVTLGRWPC